MAHKFKETQASNHSECTGRAFLRCSSSSHLQAARCFPRLSCPASRSESKFPSSRHQKVPEHSRNATMHGHRKQQTNFRAFATWACEQSKRMVQFRYA
jgi:hypothetical protein